MKKRILSALMACILMLSLIPTFSLHAEAAASKQAKDVVAAAMSYASSGKAIGVMCAGMVCKAAKEAGVTSSQMNLKATIASPFVGTNQFGYIDSSGNLKYGCKAYTWKDFADGSYTPKTGDLVFYGYMKSGGGTASKTIAQVAKSGDYYHTHVGIIRNDNSTMSKLYTVDGGQNSSSDTSHYTYVKTKDRSISNTSTGYAYTSSGNKIYVMEFVRPNYNMEYNVELFGNYSGKNYMPSVDAGSFNLDCFDSRDTSVAVMGADSSVKRVSDCDTLKIVNFSAGSSGKDLRFITYAGGRAADGAYGSNQSLILSFWAKASNPGAKMFFRWGYESESAYKSVTLTGDWSYYTIRIDRTIEMNYTIHPYVDRAGTVWISELQLEEGSTATAFSKEDGGSFNPLTVASDGTYQGLPTPSRAGYTFDGWFTKPNGGTQIANGSKALPGDIRLYAHWTADAHVHTMEYHARQDAACLSTGNVEYWFCTDCGSYYLDADGSMETTADEIVLPALGHNYSNGTCTRCGAADPDFVTSGARYQVSDVSGSPGQTVKVTVSIADNPGIIALRQSIVYDMSVLELTGVQNLGLLAGYTEPSPTVSSPYTLRWADSLATKNNTKNGAIAELTFRIKDTAKEGTYTINVNHLEARNADGSKLSFANAAARVTVRDFIVGDVDGDGEVNDWDGILLNRYLAGWTMTLNIAAADTDGDGEVTDWDGILLDRYLAGWQVTLGK